MGEKAGMCSNIISEFKKGGKKANFFLSFFKDARGSVYAIDLQSFPPPRAEWAM